MVSHVCASCGKVLDDSSRTHSANLRMWVATCPRCGVAVRWCPRIAREPARVWARLRALNIRLGVATAGIQFGAVLLIFAGGLLFDELQAFGTYANAEELLSHFGAAITLACLAGVLIGTGAATLAPFRGATHTFAVTWIAALLFGAAIWVVVVTLGASPSRGQRIIFDVLGTLTAHLLPTAFVFASALATSLATMYVLSQVIARGFRIVVRRTARARRQTLALVSRRNSRALGEVR